MTNYHRSFYHGHKGKNESFHEALRHAGRGIALGFLYESNVRRELIVALLVVLLGWWLSLTPGQWAAVVVVILGVLTVELINSSIEALADAVHPDFSEHIQRSKDLSAAAVLAASLTALVVGVYVFVPALMALVR